MKIGEVAELSGYQSSTLRYYEQIGLIPIPERVSGQRQYNPEVFTILKIIKLGTNTGFSLEEIRQLLFEASSSSYEIVRKEWQTAMRQKIQEIDTIIERYHAMKQLLEWGLECNCFDLDECELLLD